MAHRDEHHEATDGLENLLKKANHDLTLVQLKLDKEFQQTYPENANPMKIVSRIKKLQEDLFTLKDQCRELLSAKQDLIDKARTVIVGNRNSIQRMQKSMGLTQVDDSGDSAFENFNQIIDEWTVQVRSRTGDEINASDPEDVNKLLFSAIVESN
ncbi:uncharacterized protein LOC115707719 [Cannabis sativa]|uniref:Protein FAM33A n=1 Tax=Cannabis sativa TaxID=3483 RepID=A0A7J6EJS5_CANSA|nr:uncharacterized protein LOC115707719 [Cannabis sativa]KAF4358575.1 hypothetical protein F8388_014346 [Cannabis sativa]